MSEFHKLDNGSQVFFYEQEFYVLSNFSAFTLMWNGHRFDTSEAAYHWEKFSNGHDSIQDAILCAPSAHQAFKIAQQFKSLRREDWDEIKNQVMIDVLRAKVCQHEYVYKKLIETANRDLIEDSWRDSYWGWGPEKNGHNMLGKLWMQVRREIKQGQLQP